MGHTDTGNTRENSHTHTSSLRTELTNSEKIPGQTTPVSSFYSERTGKRHTGVETSCGKQFKLRRCSQSKDEELEKLMKTKERIYLKGK